MAEVFIKENLMEQYKIIFDNYIKSKRFFNRKDIQIISK